MSNPVWHDVFINSGAKGNKVAAVPFYGKMHDLTIMGRKELDDLNKMGLPAFMYGVGGELVMYNNTQYITFKHNSFSADFPDATYDFTIAVDHGKVVTRVTNTQVTDGGSRKRRTRTRRTRTRRTQKRFSRK
jgi:hypothetical protein